MQVRQICANGHHTLIFNINEIIPSNYIEINQTNVEWSIQLQASAGWNFSQVGSTISAIVNGETVYNQYAQRSINGGHTITIASGTKPITHNADGSKNINFSCSLSQTTSASYSPGNASLSGNLSLKTIPRTSSFVATDAEIEGISKITINNLGSFNHTLMYSFGTLNGTIASNINSETSWTIPTSFYDVVKNSPGGTGTCTITCATYSGNSKIGETTKSITIKCDESKCKPVISASVIDINAETSALSSKLIRYKSTARITPTATAKNGANITKVMVNNEEVTDYLDIYNVSKNIFEITAIDSRGFKTTINKQVEMIPYINLTCSYKVKRKTQVSPKVKIIGSGNFYNGSIENLENTLNISYSYREKGSNDWILGATINVEITNNIYAFEFEPAIEFNYKKSYEFIVYYSDKLNNLNSIQLLKKGLPSLGIFERGLKVNNKKIFSFNDEDIKIGSDLLNMIYPIGSIYISINSNNPSVLFGGTWEQIKDKFLLASGENYSAGSTGGSEEHNHGLTTAVANMRVYQGNMYMDAKNTISEWHDQYKFPITLSASDSNNSTGIGLTGNTDNGYNMPPYLAVYIWKRIS